MIGWRIGAWIAAAAMTAVVGFSMLRIPVQVTDSVVVMLQAQAAPSAALTNFVNDRGFLRPVFWSQIRLLLDVATPGGRYYLVFRGFHVLLVAVLIALFTRAARVDTRAEFAAFAFALLVLVGHHTFRGIVWEAYPVNHYLEIVVYCLAAFVLSQSSGGWWADALAVLIFLLAVLTIESGVIVWVVYVAGRLTGMRGVSWKGIGVVTLALAAYFYVRFVYLSTGVPLLEERATGFGFGKLEPSEIVQRFSAAPYMLFAYNVVASLMSVLFSEPRGGIFEMTRRWLAGELIPSVVVSFASAAVTTGLIGWFAATRVTRWMARRFDSSDQVMLVFLAVLAANAAVCYAYTKDEIMSTAGAFYALAVFVAARGAAVRFAATPRPIFATAALAVFLVAGSSMWAVRAAGLHFHMYYSAYYLRNEWASVDTWLAEQRVDVTTADGRRLVDDLRTAAIEMPVLNPHFLPRWAERWFA